MNIFLKTCCCFSLQTGSILIGFLSLFSGIFVFINTLTRLILAFLGDDENTDESAETQNNANPYVLMTIQMIGSVLTILVAILALIAAFKNREHKFLLPWLGLNPISMLTGFGFTLYFAVLQWIEKEIAMGLGFFVASVSVLAIGILIWWVIVSYYFELREEAKKKNATNPSTASGIGGLVLGLIQMFSALNADAVDDSVTLSSSALEQIFGSLVFISLTVSVLVSAFNNRTPMLLVPWLVLKFISFFWMICYGLYSGVVFAVLGDAEGVAFVAGIVVGAVLYFYFWLVVYSYYHELTTGMKKETQCNEKY